MPAVFGELLAGLLMGPTVLGLVTPDGALSDLAELGVLVLMFLAGLETDLLQLRSVGKSATLVAVGGVVLSMAAGFGLAQATGFGLAPSLFASAIVASTSVGIAAQVFWQLGRLLSREGQTVLAAAVFDDVLGVIVLTLVVAVVGGAEVLLPLAKMGLFFVAAVVLGQYALPIIAVRMHRHLSSETLVAIVLAMVLVSSWLASEVGGVAAITGAYMAGVFIGRTHIRGKTLRNITSIGFGFLIPLFFVSVGMAVTPQDLGLSPVFAALFTVAAIVAKTLGCLGGARVSGMNWTMASRVGFGMVARGEVALVIAAVGLKAGYIDAGLYSAAVVMTLASALVTPLLLKLSYGGGRPSDQEGELGPLTAAMVGEG